jgi:hypothetical protein
MRRFDKRGLASVVGALLLVAIGTWRFASDLQGDLHRHDLQSEYWRELAKSPWRYVMRSPSDGSFLGDLNTQWFKILSIPCAISLVYLWFRRRYGSLKEGARRFSYAPIRAVWIGTFFVAFTIMEFEKEFGWFGNMAPMLPGESFWKNHLAHVISAGLAWLLASRFSFAPVFVDDAAEPAKPA